MIINSFEIYNFRKLHRAKLDLSGKQTLLVGANNSGKTSAMVALRYFLKDRGGITARDVTASNWKRLEVIAKNWLDKDAEPQLLPLLAELPYMDVWLHVSDHELHQVAHLIPNLEWNSGILGVRVRLEPKAIADVFNEYRDVRQKALDRLANYAKAQAAKVGDLDLSRFDAAPLIAFTATKETNYGTETDGRISPGCGAYRADQWADAQAGG